MNIPSYHSIEVNRNGLRLLVLFLIRPEWRTLHSGREKTKSAWVKSRLSADFNAGRLIPSVRMRIVDGGAGGLQRLGDSTADARHNKVKPRIGRIRSLGSDARLA